MRIVPTSFVLGVATLAFLGIRPAWSDSSHQTSTAPTETTDKERSFHVDVFLRDSSQLKSSVSSSSVVEVNDTLRPVLPGTSPDTVAEDLRLTLEGSYPGKVTATSRATYYKAVWCDEIKDFKIVCCELFELEVELVDVVVVSLEVGTQLD